MDNEANTYTYTSDSEISEAQTKDDTSYNENKCRLAAPTSDRNNTHEWRQLIQHADKKKSNSDSEYVKLEDLKDIVSKLLSGSVVGQSLANLREKNKRLCLMTHHLASDLLRLNKRVDQLASRLQEIIQEGDTRGSKPHKLFKSSQRRTTANNAKFCGFCDEAGSAFNKPGAPNIANDRPTLKQLLTVEKGRALPRLEIRKAPSRETQRKRREAQFRQYQANMLMYRKSRYSLRQNGNFENFKITYFRGTQCKTPLK